MTSSTHATTTVLVVEDNADAREIFTWTLQEEGYRVIEATDGIEALQRLEESPVEVILTDLRMPRMSGFELARKAKEIPAYRDIPIILITATPIPDRATTAKLFSALLVKPCSVAELVSTVERVISS